MSEYPDAFQLKRIKEWELNCHADYILLAKYIEAVWNNQYGRVILGRKVLKLVTG